MAARITKYLNKYMRTGLCLIYMSSFYFWSPPLSWRPEVDHNWAIMVVQPTILTYPTMVFNFWLAPQVIWNDLRGIVGTTKYLNKYVRRGLCLIYISSFYFWSPPLPRKMRKSNVLYYPKWSTGNSYQAEALTNVLRYHTCRSSHSEDRKLPITELKWDALGRRRKKLLLGYR
jgi:hypothetical protein